MNTASTLLIQGLRRALFASLALGCAAGVAEAGESPAPDEASESRVVSYADLDLVTGQGSKIMYARLKSAAEDVCGTVPETRDLRRQQAWQGCVNAAIGQAVIQADSATLQALHARKSSRARLG